MVKKYYLSQNGQHSLANCGYKTRKHQSEKIDKFHIVSHNDTDSQNDLLMSINSSKDFRNYFSLLVT